MKIAFIAVKGMPYGGGIEKFTAEVGSRLVRKGHEVIVYCTNLHKSSSPFYNGMKIKKMPALRSRSLEKISLSLISTLHMLAKEDVDIAHFHSVGGFFSLLPRIKGIKTLGQIHSLEWKKEKWNEPVKFFLRLSDYASCSFPNKTIVVSEVLKRFYGKKYKRNLYLISNGVEKPLQRKSELITKIGLNRGNYILYMGRLSREKGVHYLIDAYNGLKTRKALVLAGDFADDRKYENLIREKISLRGNIRLTGFVDGAFREELFSNAFLYVLPSEIEGSPIALLEAMSYGNCCVVSDIPENLETLSGCGHTFNNKDSKDLKRMLQLLLSRKGLVDAYKEKAKEYVLNNYSWDKVTERLENLYLSLLEKS